MVQNSLIPVTRQRHKGKFWKRFSSFDFARKINECAVVDAEILQIAASFPIVFRRSDQCHYPVAMLSMEANCPTPFVSTQGKWLAMYVPSGLRCFPFRYELPEHNHETNPLHFDLLVDESSGLVTNEPADELFFDQEGNLGPELAKVQAFFQALSKSMQDTLHLCKVLSEMGLFAPLSSFQGMPLPNGLFGINASALQKTHAANMSLLAKTGGLRLIHAHQVSLTHFTWLSQAQKQAVLLTDKKAEHPASKLPDFLDALVTAQEAESTLEHHNHEGQYATLW